MIEKSGVLVHLDPKGDRIGDADLEFDGWVAAERPVQAVWLPATGKQRLTTCDRPDVTRVFPNRTALGFSGTSKGRDIGPNGLRLAIQLGDETLEIEHPLPPPLARLSLPERIVSALQLLWLRGRARLTTDSFRRWTLALRRHLLYRRRRSGVFRRSHTDALLSDFATAIPDAVFVQIGANDGFTGDPLNHLITRPDMRWRGVLVEPVAHLFAKLSERYGHDPALRLEQAAIGERDGVIEIHRLQTTADDSLWLEQLPSLDPALLQQNASEFGKAETPTVTEIVPCLSVATLLVRHQMDRFDLLVIDAEGWDWRLLRQFDLPRLQPKLILYEHQHLTPEERGQAHQFLAQHSYQWAETEEGDTVAWRLG
jgi:FkbM family methyltransferase